jgi:multidrug efflux pump subunit AcrA (membrane-fusion protein)
VASTISARERSISAPRWVTVEPTPDLLPGMFVSARVVIGQTPHPVVPETAVVQRGKIWHAFVAANGVLEDRIVKLGPRPGGGRVSIVRGLTPNDRVVQVVTDKIVDGLRVE